MIGGLPARKIPRRRETAPDRGLTHHASRADFAWHRGQGSQVFFDTAGSADKTLTFHEGHAHDLLNDVDKEGLETYQQIRAHPDVRHAS